MIINSSNVSLANIPLLVAHRGYADKFPENSLLALAQAIDCGACLLEFDVQLTRDKVPILLHDDNLLRVSGVNKSIYDLDATDLGNYNLSEPDRFGLRYKNNQFSLLADVVDFMQSYPDIKILLEVKQESIDFFSIDEVLQIISSIVAPIMPQTVVICYNLALLQSAKANFGFSSGFIVSAWSDIESAALLDLGPEMVICNYKKIPQDYNQFRQNSWDWVLYEITDPLLALKYGNLGVKYIETMALESMFANIELKSRACNA